MIREPYLHLEGWQPPAIPFTADLDGHVEIPAHIWIHIDQLLNADREHPEDDAANGLQAWCEMQVDARTRHIVDYDSYIRVDDDDIDTLTERMRGATQAAATVTAWLCGIR